MSNYNFVKWVCTGILLLSTMCTRRRRKRSWNFEMDGSITFD